MNFRHKHIFLLPGLLVLIGILIFPILFTIRLSLSSWDSSIPVWISSVLKTTSGCSLKTNASESFFRLSFLSLTTVFLQ